MRKAAHLAFLTKLRLALQEGIQCKGAPLPIVISPEHDQRISAARHQTISMAETTDIVGSVHIGNQNLVICASGPQRAQDHGVDLTVPAPSSTISNWISQENSMTSQCRVRAGLRSRAVQKQALNGMGQLDSAHLRSRSAVMVQMISEMTPTTSSSEGADSRKVDEITYRGDVPMSPAVKPKSFAHNTLHALLSLRAA